MTINFKNKKSGFSIMELLVYAFGAVVLLASIIYLILEMYSLYKQMTVVPRVDRTGIAIVDRIVKDIRSGDTINLSESDLSVSTGQITINSKVGTNDVIKKFAYDNGRVSYQENSGTINYLSPQDVSISKLEFIHMTTPISQSVRIDLAITYKIKDETYTKNYIGFAILRHSYE